jgi:hypothetical protein
MLNTFFDSFFNNWLEKRLPHITGFQAQTWLLNIIVKNDRIEPSENPGGVAQVIRFVTYKNYYR